MGYTSEGAAASIVAAVKSLLKETEETVAGGECGGATAGGERAFSAVARVCLLFVSLSVCVNFGLCLCRPNFARSLSLSVRSM